MIKNSTGNFELSKENLMRNLQVVWVWVCTCVRKCVSVCVCYLYMSKFRYTYLVRTLLLFGEIIESLTESNNKKKAEGDKIIYLMGNIEQ